MSSSPSPDEDRELIGKLRKPDAWQAYFHGNGSFSAIEEAAPFKAADRLESLLSDRAKLEEIVAVANELVNGGGLQLRSGNVPRLTVVETSDKTDPHYRLCTLLAALNRSTDHAT